MQILKKLSEALKIDFEVLAKNLEVDENSTDKEIKEKLGFYALFQEKTDLESFIKNKVQNKLKEIDELNNFILEKDKALNEKTNLLNKANDENASFLNKIKTLFKNNLESLNYKNFNLDNLDISSIDFNNINDSIKKYIEINKLEPEHIKPTNYKNNVDFISEVPKAQRFFVGSKRTGE